MSEAEEQAKALRKQMEAIEKQAKKYGEGYSKIGSYLKGLYHELDDCCFNLPLNPKEKDNLYKANKEYQSTLTSARKQMAKYDSMGKLVKKVLSGTLGTQQEFDNIMSEIGKSEQAVINGAGALYQLMDPEIDAYNIISVYSNLAAEKKKDIGAKLKEGLSILEDYYLPEKVTKQMKSDAAKRRQAGAKAA